ncbi:MAG: DUF3619 family protein [Nitrosomonas sp.]|jgi:hypothetical protein|uniref:DUF3619 family protein n=1 Tax=Nitrosomonas sp. TaxID=42353 RepID=UPI001D4903AA|nr:DUF3619 family protein [Nitrosomonas sp.]MBX9895499.1 DUF3619 family protein [Nitrosomonas sp.]
MNEHEFGKKVVTLLDQSTNETIKQSTLYRLQSARRAALEQCEPESLKLINSGRGNSVYGRSGGHHDAGKLLLLLTVLFIFMNVFLSQFFEHDNNMAIDVQILADELPVDAYIDNEFEEWLDID